jgi:hypothetical protein
MKKPQKNNKKIITIKIREKKKINKKSKKEKNKQKNNIIVLSGSFYRQHDFSSFFKERSVPVCPKFKFAKSS